MGLTRFALGTKSWLGVATLLLAPLLAGAQQAVPPVDYSALFDKTDVMIIARDGVKMHTEIYAPKNAAAKTCGRAGSPSANST